MADQPTFESVEEIHAYYGRLLKDAPDDDPKKVSLELEQARAEANLYRNERTQLQRQSWVQQALSEFPHATASDLRGETQDEIAASAKAIHDRIEEARAAVLAEREKDLTETTGRRAYGRAGIAGGGSPVVDADAPNAVIQRGKTAYQNRLVGATPTEDPKKLLDAHFSQIPGIGGR